MTMMGEINPMATGTVGGIATRGFNYMQVVIKGITPGGLAICQDQFNRKMEIPIAYRRAKGALPQINETWVVDRTLGYWTFACVLMDVRPAVTGNTGGNTALISLLQQLDAIGLISNQTTTP